MSELELKLRQCLELAENEYAVVHSEFDIHFLESLIRELKQILGLPN